MWPPFVLWNETRRKMSHFAVYLCSFFGSKILCSADSHWFADTAKLKSRFHSFLKSTHGKKASAKTIFSSFTHILFFKQPSCNNLVWTDAEQTAKRLLFLLHNIRRQLFWLIIISLPSIYFYFFYKSQPYISNTFISLFKKAQICQVIKSQRLSFQMHFILLIS